MKNILSQNAELLTSQFECSNVHKKKVPRRALFYSNNHHVQCNEYGAAHVIYGC